MARVYIQPSWVDACSDHSEWSGQSPNNRKCSSYEIHWTRDGQANILAYGDKPPKKQKPSIPIAHTINPWSKKLDELDEKEAILEGALKDNSITLDEYGNLYYVLCMEREKAFRGYMKSIGQLDGYMKEQKQEYNKITGNSVGWIKWIVFFVFVIIIISGA